MRDPTTGPHTVPTPPNIVTIKACADVERPNAVSRSNHQKHDGVQPAGDTRERAAYRDGLQLPDQTRNSGGFGRKFVLLDRQQR